MTPTLDGRVALVTGAGGRLGAAIAGRLAADGARVWLTGRDRDRLERVAAGLGESCCGVVPAELRREADIERLFATVGEALDVLVNNAGRASAVPFEDVGAEEFLDVLSLNVVATFLCARRAAVAMGQRGGGRIVNVGSIYGTVGVDPRLYEGSPGMVSGSVPYVASKSALVALTRDLAVRFAPRGIQVNLVSPGGVRAQQPEAFQQAYRQRTPQGRLAEPDDVAGAVSFLASDDAGYITGQNLLVDGGFTSW